jgi:hypothetical protein
LNAEQCGYADLRNIGDLITDIPPRSRNEQYQDRPDERNE